MTTPKEAALEIKKSHQKELKRLRKALEIMKISHVAREIDIPYVAIPRFSNGSKTKTGGQIDSTHYFALKTYIDCVLKTSK